MKIALVIGASGLTGSFVLSKLFSNNKFNKVLAITRKPLNIRHPKLENIIYDFDLLSEIENNLKADVYFCCLGSTIKKAGSKYAFKQSDYEYPLKFASLAQKNKAVFVLVSAMGANPNSSIFYNKVKGLTEKDILALNNTKTYILRPSLILGPRKESRFGEDIAKLVFKYINFLFVGTFKKYKAIQAETIAQAMINIAAKEPAEIIIENDKIFEWALKN